MRDSILDFIVFTVPFLLFLTVYALLRKEARK